MASVSKQELIEELERLANGGKPKDKEEGICHHFRGFLADWAAWKIWHGTFKSIWKTWDKFSGDVEYPIEIKGKSPKKIYWNTENLWTRKQGQLRRELCQYLADELKKMDIKGF